MLFMSKNNNQASGATKEAENERDMLTSRLHVCALL